MAIAVDNTATFDDASYDTTTSNTISFTVGSGSNRLLIVTASYWEDVAGTGTITGITYAGTSMTQVVTATETAMSTYIYRLVAPTSGTNNIVITTSGATDSRKFGVISFTGVNQTTPINASNTAIASTSGPLTASLTTTVANTMLVDAASNFSANTITPGTGQTVIFNTTSNGVSGGASYKAFASTGSTSMQWTTAGIDDWSYSIVAVAPASGGVANTSSLTAGLSFSGAFIKKTSKKQTASVSFVGSQVRLISKKITAGLSFIGSIGKSTRRSVTAGLSFVGSFVSSHLFIVALTASLSFVGSNLRSIRKGMTASLSFSGGFVKLISRTLTASLSFVGSFIKLTQRAFTASLTFVGSLLLGILHKLSLTASVSFSGTQIHRINKSMTAGLSFSGGFIKRITHSFTAGLSFIGTFVKQSRKLFTGGLSFIGAFLTGKAYVRAFTASVGFSGAIAKGITKRFTASLGFTGLYARAFVKTFTAALSFSGNLGVVANLISLINARLRSILLIFKKNTDISLTVQQLQTSMTISNPIVTSLSVLSPAPNNLTVMSASNSLTVVKPASVSLMVQNSATSL